MPLAIGAKKWRERFDSTKKLSCNLQLSGDEARAVIEFMEAEGLPGPAAAIRMLMGVSLDTYPEWAAGVATRRAMAIQTRMWATNRCVEKLREVIDELETGIEQERLDVENEAIEKARENYENQG